MNKNNIKTVIPLTLLASIAIGCDNKASTQNTDYSTLQASPVSGEPLTKASEEAFEQYLKNGIRTRLSQSDFPSFATDDAAVAESDSNADASSQSGGFSSTNVHEAGVDESDRLKYDGEFLYVVTNAYYGHGFAQSSAETDDGVDRDTDASAESLSAPYNPANKIRILRTDSDQADAEEVASIHNDAQGLAFSSIYLRPQQKQLISLSNTHYYAWDAVYNDHDWQWNNGKIELNGYNVSDPLNPRKQWKLELEGSLQESRRIDDKLYVVTRYIPNIFYIDYGADNPEDNEDVIRNTPLSDLLPHYRVNDGSIKSLVTASDCLIPSDTEKHHGYADLISIIVINLDNSSIDSAVCLNANVQGIYSSQDNMYIGGTSLESWSRYSNLTSVHKFSLDKGAIAYRATAAVPGYLGWDDPSFRMDEVDDDLRIVTTDFRHSGTPVHQLTILREDKNGNRMKVVSTLPNDQQSSPIGKPGEDIYAVRFTDEFAYVVTFERIDPLYVIDLKNHDVPIIAGELEIPGFSRFLHPVSEGWLLGIGQEVKDQQTQGVKVELYDVRDITTPQVKNTIVLGGPGSYSEVFYNLKALTMLDIDAQNKRFAFPADIWDTRYAYQNQWLGSGLFAFDLVSDNTNSYDLSLSGRIIAESPDQNQHYAIHSGNGRSVIHNNAVYYLHGDQIYSNTWGSWHIEQGPF